MSYDIKGLTRKENHAILAGLRLLMSSLDNGSVVPNDGDIGDILTCSGDHEGLDAGEIDDLCARIMHG